MIATRIKLTCTLCLVFLTIFTSFAQEQERVYTEYGKPSMEEMRMKLYAKDTTASAVVLYEKGEYKFELIENRIVLSKTVHRRIKVFNAQRFEDSEVMIYLLKGEKSSERLVSLKGTTYNGLEKQEVKATNRYETDVTERYKIVSFAFPKVRDGSILEYKYRVESNFFFNFGDWSFQGKYPKIYSEFVSEVPFNYTYNKVLLGDQALDVNLAFNQASCIMVPSYRYTDADCEMNIYAMYHVPAHKEEPVMLSVDNYISKLRHELSEVQLLEGKKLSYTKSWEDVDKEFKKDKNVGKQLNNEKYFKKALPEAVLNISSKLERAKAIYTYIKDYMNWNGKYRIFSSEVTNAYESKTGNNAEVNLALINALNAAGIPAKIALISTRDNGLPTLAYPVYTEFDFLVAYIVIDRKPIFLDATQKEVPFGMLPFRDLNIFARVMDFDKGSFWETINPINTSSYLVRSQINVNQDGSVSSENTKTYTGYLALGQRLATREYINNEMQAAFIPQSDNHEVIQFTVNNLKAPEQELQAVFNTVADLEELGNQFLLNPFELTAFYDNNPFNDSKRKYPVDFGFPQSYTALIAINIDPAYKTVSLPDDVQTVLDNNDGLYSCNFTQQGNQVIIRMQFKLTGFQFQPDRGPELKALFDSLLSTQQKYIVLERS